jgi:quercetin dioxygenase-like cupin family protein
MEKRFFARGDYAEVGVGEGGLSRRLLGFGGSLMLAEMDFESGAESVAHAHEAEQLTYCQTGEFECAVGGEIRPLHPGDSFYAAPGIPHGARCIRAGRLLHVFTPQREDYKGG